MMKHTYKRIPFALSLLLLISCNNTQRVNDVKPQSAVVFPKGEKVTNQNFTGTVYLQMLMESDSVNTTSVENVTFEPGARTK